MALAFSAENRSRVEKILARYPNKMAACLPVLYVAQEQFGHVGDEAQELVAATLGLPPAHVHGVATFYTMFNKQPVGRYHLQVCTNVSCMLCGASDVMARAQRKLGLKPGETDGLFTLSEVECLAYCGTGPAVQVNDEIHELLSPDKVEDLIDALRAQAAAPSGRGSAGKQP
jgi:NADH-quinone oxidoreductase E subunit